MWEVFTSHQDMQKEIKELFPEWTKKEEMENIQSLCLTDDIDSLFSSIVLKKIFPQLTIDAFYGFDCLFKTDTKIKSIIGVDMELLNGKCWGNHVTLLSAEDKKNKKCANLNTVINISRDNYYEKYCGSVLLQIISYYNLDITKLTEEAKMILLCVDSTFLGYWFNNGYYCKKYLKILELDNLLEVLQKHSKADFELLNRKYNLKSKIYINNDGKLNTDIRLDKLKKLFPNLPFILPKKQFYFVKEYKNIGQATYRKTKKGLSNKKIFSLAVTNKNFVKYSVA